jgi:hypothetical protein
VGAPDAQQGTDGGNQYTGLGNITSYAQTRIRESRNESIERKLTLQSLTLLRRNEIAKGNIVDIASTTVSYS